MKKIRDVLDMILEYIYSSTDLGSVQYLFTVITPSSTLDWSGSICVGPIYQSNLFKNCPYSIGLYEKKKKKPLKKHYIKNINMNIQ